MTHTCFGEILWDLLPSGPQLGGAPMNVSYHLQQLGEKATMISRIGIDNRGEEILSILKERNLSSEYIQIDHHIATGIVHVNSNGSEDMQYEIVAPAAWDHITASDELHHLVRRSECFVFGSLITRNATSRKTLFELLESATCRVLDINLRSPFIDRATVDQLLRKADIVKMNLEELKLIGSWFCHYDSPAQLIAGIQKRFNLKLLIVTKGGNGADVLVEGNLYSHPGYRVQVADTVGSGDAFLAAFLHKWLPGKRPEQALEFACSLGSLIATKRGGCPEYSLEELQF